MDEPSSRMIAYTVDPNSGVRLTMCGVRAPQAPFAQPRRQMADFAAFMVVKGEIRLSDEMPDGTDHIMVRPGEVHVIAPGLWQTSTVPFPAGMVFLWFHFTLGAYQASAAPAVDQAVRALHQQPGAGHQQSRWLIPRHLQLGDQLDAMTSTHGELLENERLWGIADRGTQAIGALLIYRLHRIFTQQRLRGRELTAIAPDVAHVSRARAFIRLNHERPISLAEVAEAVGLTPTYLSRCCRRVSGHTVGEIILAARIETAKRLLLEGCSVKEAAFHAGFASASYFCRMFRRQVGTTPLTSVALPRNRRRTS